MTDNMARRRVLLAICDDDGGLDGIEGMGQTIWCHVFTTFRDHIVIEVDLDLPIPDFKQILCKNLAVTKVGEPKLALIPVDDANVFFRNKKLADSMKLSEVITSDIRWVPG